MVSRFCKRGGGPEPAPAIRHRNVTEVPTEPFEAGKHPASEDGARILLGIFHVECWKLNVPCLSLLWLAAALVLPGILRAEIPAYKLGDVATQEVVTPVALTVINPESTQALRDKEARRTPPIIRFRAQSSDEAEAALHAAFISARTNFNTAFDRVTNSEPSGEHASEDVLLLRAVEITRRRTNRFPLLDELAPVWARNGSDATAQNGLVEILRKAMSQPIISGKVPAMFGPKSALTLVPVSQLDQSLTVNDVQQRGRIERNLHAMTLVNARSQMLKEFAQDQQETGKFLAKFITTNAVPEAELTQLIRTRQTEGLCVTDTYQAGEVIARTGQTIDAKTLAALDAMREKSAIATLQDKLDQQQQTAATSATVSKLLDNLQQKLDQQKQQAPAARDWPLVAWIGGGFGLVVGLLALILWRIRSRKQSSLLPVLAAEAGTVELDWRERAVLAEARAAEAHHLMKGEFMQWMREKLIQGLFHQRAELLSAQQNAEAEMRRLEQRLEQLQAPLQERISAYEKRIVELERDLAVKGEENRELIKAKITLAKHQLSLERERGGSRFGTN